MNQLLFLIGCALPFISFSQLRGHGDAGVVDRVAIVDVFASLFLLLLAIRGGLRIKLPVLAYAVSLSIAMLIGLSDSPTGPYARPLIGFLALFMALFYLVIGFSIAQDSEAKRWLINGVLVGIGLESVIVLHDYFLPGQWFPDPLAGRVRGTFRASGQLGSFGFSAAAIAIVHGQTVWAQSKRWWLPVFAAVLSTFFVVAASRRSGIFSIAIWAIIFSLISVKKLPIRFIWGGAVTAVLLFVAFLTFGAQVQSSFLVDRLSSALASFNESDNFIFHQARAVVHRANEWIPFGIGLGNGKIESLSGIDSHEIHSGHLNVVVELGMLGLFCFYWILFDASKAQWADRHRSPSSRGLIALAFLLASLAFMIHNRLHRDRGFLLFVGLSSCVVAGRCPSDVLTAPSKEPSTIH